MYLKSLSLGTKVDMIRFGVTGQGPIMVGCTAMKVIHYEETGIIREVLYKISEQNKT